MVDLLTAESKAGEIRRRLSESTVHVPAHFDAEVLSALGHLARAGKLTVDEVTVLVNALERAPFSRHLLPELLNGAWARRESLRLVDALYIELAERLGVVLVTTDARLSKTYPSAQLP
ncbi:MAG: type II toxin-antitoxin system VapC family toxin [Mycolicibacterium sp.]|nr:type II toxin-antitoxin system VapC family toxin [Mycolicibacterium sp.]